MMTEEWKLSFLLVAGTPLPGKPVCYYEKYKFCNQIEPKNTITFFSRDPLEMKR